MKSNELMLGNIVAVFGNHEPNVVLSIENKSLYLGKREFSVDERDIEGIPLTNWIDMQTNNLKKGKIIIACKGIKLEFIVKRSHKKAILIFVINSHSTNLILTYMHQLQNLFFILTGVHLNPEQKWDSATHDEHFQ